MDADVLVVGLRCAGAPLALALARAGVKVVAIDRDELYTDQPFSTHAIVPFGMRLLDRIGLGDAVRALAPRGRAMRMQVEDEHLEVDLRSEARDARCPRRSKLDPLLQRAVVAAGVDVRPRTTVLDLLRDGDRVVGVRVRDARGEHEIRAALVVGADGRNSTIARLAGAEAYVEDTSPHGAYWTYFEETPEFANRSWSLCIHMQGDGSRAVFQTDSGLLLMAGLARSHRLADWKRDPDAALLAYLRAGELTAPLVEGAKAVAPAIGLAGLRFFMKPPVGKGWALVGDAGLHLDPTPGFGITDAFRDAIALAAAIVEGGERPLERYWRKRDAETIGLYRMASDMGAGNYNCPFTRMVYRRTRESAAMQARLLAVLDRECRPQDMLPPWRLVSWIAAELARGHVASLRGFAGTLGRTLALVREQARFDRALAAVISS